MSRIAIIGSGPTGIYTLKGLLESDAPLAITIYEANADPGKGTPYHPRANDRAMLANIASIELPPVTESLTAWLRRKTPPERRVIGKNLTDLLCYGAVDLGPWLYDDQSGAFSRGRDRGHRGAQVEFARLMACRCDNATGSCSVYSQGFPLSPGLSRCPTDA